MSDLQLDIPFDQYAAIKRMNASTLIHGFKSMLSLRRAIEGEKPEETAAMRFGQQYHKLILEPEDFEAECVVMPDFRSHPDNVKDDGKRSTRRTKWSAEQEAKFASENRSKQCVERKYYDQMLMMLESLHTHARIRQVLRDAVTEVTVIGTLANTDCKGRIDILCEDGIYDLKGTNSVTPHHFSRTACNLYYPEKLAFYRELMAQKTGERLPCYIIAIETSGDFDRVLMPVPTEVLDHAAGRVQRLLLEYENALETNNWPGVDGGQESVDFQVPNWWLPEDGDDQDLDWTDVAPLEVA